MLKGRNRTTELASCRSTKPPVSTLTNGGTRSMRFSVGLVHGERSLVAATAQMSPSTTSSLRLAARMDLRPEQRLADALPERTGEQHSRIRLDEPAAPRHPCFSMASVH